MVKERSFGVDSIRYDRSLALRASVGASIKLKALSLSLASKATVSSTENPTMPGGGEREEMREWRKVGTLELEEGRAVP